METIVTVFVVLAVVFGHKQGGQVHRVTTQKTMFDNMYET